MLKKFLFPVLAACLFTVACRKNDDTGLTLADGEWFTLGYSNCAWVSYAKSYKLQGGQLFLKDSLTCQVDTVIYPATTLSADKLALAQDLLEKFPDKLLTADPKLEIGTCYDCASYGLTLYQNGQLKHWWFSEGAELPDWVEEFAGETVATIKKL